MRCQLKTWQGPLELVAGLAAAGGFWVMWSGDGSNAMRGQGQKSMRLHCYFSKVRMQTVSLSCEQLQ